MASLNLKKGEMFVIGVYNTIMEKLKDNPEDQQMYFLKVGLILSEIKTNGFTNELLAKFQENSSWYVRKFDLYILWENHDLLSCCENPNLEDLNGFIFCTTCGEETGETVRCKKDYHCMSKVTKTKVTKPKPRVVTLPVTKSDDKDLKQKKKHLAERQKQWIKEGIMFNSFIVKISE